MAGRFIHMTIISRLAKKLPPLRKLVLERDELLAAVQQLHGGDCLPGHFSSPIPSRAEIDAHAAHWAQRHEAPLAGIDLRPAEQLALLSQLCPLWQDLPFRSERSPGLRYFYRNDWFCKHDAIVLCAMLRHLKPRRVIEVGSGFSSAAMLDVNDRFLGRETRLTFIEPHPDRLESLLAAGDRQAATIHRAGVQSVDLSVFDTLEPSDVLLIDSSHVSRVGSDVNHLMFKVLPRLKPGVHVHFHDIYYPFDYPPQSLLAGHYWNEAYLLHAFLQYNSAFQIELFNSWVWPHADKAIREAVPLDGVSEPSSLWLVKTG